MTARTDRNWMQAERIATIRKLVCEKYVPVEGSTTREDLILDTIASVLGGGVRSMSHANFVTLHKYLDHQPAFVPRHRRSSLSKVVSDIVRVRRDHREGYEMDSGYDGGEFSGPFHENREREDVEGAIVTNGWTHDDLVSELQRRTTKRWAHFVDMGWF